MARWKLEGALRRARIGYRLAKGLTDPSTVERRLPPNFFEKFQADRALLGDPSARDAAARLRQKIATRVERSLAEEGYRLIMDIREIVKTEDVPAELRTAVGVGDGLRPADTDGVLTVLASIIEHEAALTPLGVVNDDIVEALDIHTKLGEADDAQDAAFDTREASTEARRDAHERLEQAIVRLSTRGAIAFRKDPVMRARFERLRSDDGPTQEDEDEAGEEPIPLDPAAP